MRSEYWQVSDIKTSAPIKKHLSMNQVAVCGK